MTGKDIGELKRHFNIKRTSITKIYGCFVNAGGQIVSSFCVGAGSVTDTEFGMYLDVLKKTLSGSPEKNILPIDISRDRSKKEELETLRNAFNSQADSDGEDAAVREEFYQKIIDVIDTEGENYLILAANDVYDIPHRGEDGEVDADESDGVFSYIISAICPVKDTKPSLCYEHEESKFLVSGIAQAINPPTVGFIYPSFTDRYSDPDTVSYYIKKTDEPHDELVDALFGAARPMTITDKREAFADALREAVDGPCDFDTFTAIHKQVYALEEAKKSAEEPEDYSLTTEEVESMLSRGGLSKDVVDSFADNYAKTFSANDDLDPADVMDGGKFEVVTTHAKITVSPAAASMLHVKTIDGHKYILIPADEGIEVNGFEVK